MMEKTIQDLLIEFSNELIQLKRFVHPEDRGEFFEKLLHAVMIAATWGAKLNESEKEKPA